MMYWFDHGAGGWGYAMMLFNMLIFWGLVTAAAVLLYRALRRGDDTGLDAARRTLVERYARGEIDDEEYRRRLDTLVRH
ncbi:SHOCT domain-containing protein [Actinomycetes bacterium KLBMP 9797]